MTQLTRLYAVHSDGYLCKVASLDKYAKYEEMLEAAKNYVTMEGEPTAFIYTCESDGGSGMIMKLTIPDY